MEQQFKDYQRRPVDLVQHCLEQKSKHGKNLLVFIGTDSISIAGNCHYFTVVAFRYGQSGAHFIFSKCKHPVIRLSNGKPDIYMKLWKEAVLTMEVAEFLTNERILSKDEIILEFDYNGLVKTLSTQLISGAKGWATQLGYNTLTKCNPNAREKLVEYVEVFFGEEVIQIDQQIAVKAANHLCQGV